MHFTYKSGDQGQSPDLQQGDLLKITAGLQEVLAKYHPHYAHNSDYKYLIVLSQSCDLQRRDSRGTKTCKSKYITLAAVRPLGTVIDRELDKFQRRDIEKQHRLCCKDERRYMVDFLRKLLNNNIHEYFYLAEDVELQIEVPHVAFLALSVAIKAEHYDLCLNARFAQLAEIFQAKLGRLVGDYYSRVATPDWVPTACGNEEEFGEYIDELLKGAKIVWVTEKCLAILSREQEKRGSVILTRSEVVEIVEEFGKDAAKKKEKIVDYFCKQVQGNITGISGASLEKLKMKVMNDSEYTQLLK